MIRRSRKSLTIWLAASLLATLALAGCMGKKEALARKSLQGTGTTAEPDKVLYEKALADIAHNRMDEGRLALQTLINTYPDSEYLAKAKLAVADSYYKQGGPTGMTQAIAEYQDFITFFPFLDEAAYAQMQIGMAHYKNMEKPDRDRDEAIEAEGALQTFLQKYPDSKLAPDAQQRLREVQEVLAEGDYRVARFYYLRNADRAAGTRLFELVSRYPLYSQADRANWMLATLYARNEHNDVAAQFYTRIVKDYPLSQFAGDSKAALSKLGLPVPQPDPTSMARMQAEQQIPRQKRGIFAMPAAALRGAPDVRMAAHSGTPTMTPEDNGTGETLVPGGGMSIGVSSPGSSVPSAIASTPANTSSSTAVETVTPGSAGLGANAGGAPPMAAAPAPATSGTPPASASAAVATSASGTGTTSGTASGDSSQASQTDNTNGGQAAPASNSTSNSSQESTSKKKKGLKKLIPF